MRSRRAAGRMARQSLRQQLRQRAGFFAENLLQRFFEDQGHLAISFARRHLDEAGEAVRVDWDLKARALARKARSIRGLVARRVRSARAEQSGDYLLSEEEAVVRALLGFCDIIRWEDGPATLSEVKSQLGPLTDFRIEFQATQVIALREIAQAGIPVTIIYYVALPHPKFVEVPWAQIRQPIPPPRESAIGTGYRFRTRIPISFRDRAKFTTIPESIVPYANEQELLGILDREFQPGSRPGLG